MPRPPRPNARATKTNLRVARAVRAGAPRRTRGARTNRDERRRAPRLRSGRDWWPRPRARRRARRSCCPAGGSRPLAKRAAVWLVARGPARPPRPRTACRDRRLANSPRCDAAAPVNAPRSWPNSCECASSRESSAQLNFTYAPGAAALLVDFGGDALLAGAGFAEDQHGREPRAGASQSVASAHHRGRDAGQRGGPLRARNGSFIHHGEHATDAHHAVRAAARPGVVTG